MQRGNESQRMTDNTADRTDALDLEREEQVAKLAYDLWLERGCPEGSSEQDWLAAEEQLNNQRGRHRLKAA